jgi:dihydroneopterin aldolase
MPTIDLEVVIKTEIGIAPSELGRIQPLTIQVSADIDLQAVAQASASGDIVQTLDYGHIRKIVHHVFEGKRFNLLEEPAFQIKQQVASLPHVQQVTVSIVKSRPWPDVPTVRMTV